jgi:hypothetical protein
VTAAVTPAAGVLREYCPVVRGAAGGGCGPAAINSAVGSGTGITPPQIEQRARTPPGGTLAGSTRKMEEHCGQPTFTVNPARDVSRSLGAS